MSRARVARELGCDASTIYRWERDLCPPGLDECETLGKLYKARPAWLAFGDGPMSR